jgi:hypothetical protein
MANPFEEIEKKNPPVFLSSHISCKTKKPNHLILYILIWKHAQEFKHNLNIA